MTSCSQTGMQAYEQLADRNKDLRKTNLKLLEEKRDLLLQLQQGNRAQSEVSRLSEVCEELTKKVQVLESSQKSSQDYQSSRILNESITRADEEIAAASGQNESDKCNCESSKQLNEALKANHQWNDAFKKSIDRYHQLEKKNRTMEGELKTLKEENKILEELLKKMESDLNVKNSSPYHRSLSRERFCNNDDIEALKIQLLAYQEDFNSEKEESDSAKQQNRTLHSKLQEANAVIETLRAQIDDYKHYIAKTVEERQAVLGELRRLSDSTYFAPAPIFHEPLQRNSSYPLHPSVLLPHPLTSPRLHRSDSDIYKGADVVRDTSSNPLNLSSR